LIRVVVVVISLACATPAAAEGTSHGGLHEHPSPNVSVGLEVSAPGSDGSSSFHPHDPHAPRPVRYVAIAAKSPGNGLDNLCNAGPGPVVPGAVPWGWWYTVVAIDNATGLVISTELVCVPLVPGTNGAPPAPAVPDPPTIADIWDAVGIPFPGVGVSPEAEGVVGLDTWLWSGGPDVVQIAVTLDGYTVTGTAKRSQFRFDAGDGVTSTSVVPGSSTAPAATHVYDVKGAYAVRVASVWEATVTMTGLGLPVPVPVALGTAVLTSTLDYPVVEVRSVLVP
jgi:hypothetical protein